MCNETNLGLERKMSLEPFHI